MRIKYSILVATTATILSTSLYAGPASNFAATIREAPGEGIHLLHSGVADASNTNPTGDITNTDTVLHTDIKTANKKDLLIGVSLQSGLYTDTTVKGKNGSSEKAGAEAGVEVTVEVLDKDGTPVAVYPSSVVFASRVQELSAVLGGVIESCNVSVDIATGKGTINIANDCTVTEEEIGLMLNTTSANHFNFVAPDMESGDHTINVITKALSSAEFTNGTYTVTNLAQGECEIHDFFVSWDSATSTCTLGTADNEAKAWALVDVGSLTVQQVRAINQVGGITTDLDSGDCWGIHEVTGAGIKVDCRTGDPI